MTARPLAQPFLAGVVLLTVFGAAHAQFEEPATIQGFQITDWGGELFLESQLRYEQEQRDNGQDTTETDVFFEEGVELFGRGYVYHPNLLEWSTVLRIGATQQQTSIDGNDLTSDGLLLGYNIQGLILQSKTISGRVFGSMIDQYVARSFAQPLDLNRRTEGFEIYVRTPISLSLLFEHVDSTELSNLREDNEESYRVRMEVVDGRDPDWFTELIYEFEDTQQTLIFDPVTPGAPTTTTDRPEQRHEVILRNNWRFGDPELPHFLAGSVRALHREGFFNNELFLVNQQLNLQHSETLSSFYIGQYVFDKFEDQSEQTLHGEVGVQKRFYDSLILTVEAFATSEEFDSSEQQQYGAFLDADYRKDTPIGDYDLNLRIGRQYESENFEEGIQQIFDEAITLSGFGWERLTQPNVVAGSVTVTDITNAITYVEGVDYELRTTGQFTEIRRRIGTTGIADGETVLVDYASDRSESADHHTDIFDWSQRLELEVFPIAFYTRIRLDLDELDGGDDPGNLDRQILMLGGVELLLAPWTFAAEYEWFETDLAPPWSAYRFRGSYSHPLAIDTQLSISAHYQMLTYRDAQRFGLAPGDDFRESYGVDIDFTTKIRRNMLFRIDARFLRERGRDDQILARIGPSLEWKWGLTDFSVSGFQEYFEQEGDENMATYIEFRLTRRF